MPTTPPRNADWQRALAIPRERQARRIQRSRQFRPRYIQRLHRPRGPAHPEIPRWTRMPTSRPTNTLQERKGATRIALVRSFDVGGLLGAAMRSHAAVCSEELNAKARSAAW